MLLMLRSGQIRDMKWESVFEPSGWKGGCKVLAGALVLHVEEQR